MAPLVSARDLEHVPAAPTGAGATRPLRRTSVVMMGDIGEEITEVELEPLPDEVPAEPVAEPVPA